MTGAEQTQSCWTLTQRPTFSSLRDNLSTDVCVVGAGIAGLTTAYLLLRSGKRVIVLDKDEIGAGETSRSTAHITNALDDRYFNLEKIHGTRGAQLAAESHTAAIDLIEAIAETESIACDFIRVNGYLFAAPDSPSDILERELEACQRAGLTQVHLAEQAPVQLLPGPCLLFPRQAQFHPIKYLAGLAAAIVRQGGKIFTYSHVTATENNAKNNAPDGTERVTVSTASGGKVVASSLVVATNTPVNDVVVMHTKQA
ncbi:MAG: dependent oxidoreductase, partial [Verrucomicrobiaceae bacterium]|nr:dependent oxidoreductase [Verrucomicrobiaceae bacterium]